MTDSGSALMRPVRNVFRFFGMFVDAIYYFINSLVNPGSTGRLTSNSRGSSGPRIATLRPHGSGGNAPNMAVGGCRSCM